MGYAVVKLYIAQTVKEVLLWFIFHLGQARWVYCCYFSEMSSKSGQPQAGICNLTAPNEEALLTQKLDFWRLFEVLKYLGQADNKEYS